MWSFRLKDRDHLYQVNVEGTRHVLEAAVNAGVKHFIHVSSVAALGYKNNKTDLVDETFEFDWSIALEKHKHYMRSKYLADQVVKEFSDKINSLIVYPGLMFGPGDYNASLNLIEAFFKKESPLSFAWCYQHY